MYITGSAYNNASIRLLLNGENDFPAHERVRATVLACYCTTRACVCACMFVCVMKPAAFYSMSHYALCSCMEMHVAVFAKRLRLYVYIDGGPLCTCAR